VAAQAQAARATASVRQAEAALASARARREASGSRQLDLQRRSEHAARIAEVAAGVHAAAAGPRRDAIWPSLAAVVGADQDLLAGLTGLAQVDRLTADPTALGEIADELTDEADDARQRAASAEADAAALEVSRHESELDSAKQAAGTANAALAALLGTGAGAGLGAGIGRTPSRNALVIDRDWAHPLAGSTSTITDGFGERKNKPLPDVNEMHRGTDLAAACGTPIRAASHGTVIEAGRNGTYGNWVLIQHANGISTGYAHLESIAVVDDQQVGAGQVIGAVGSTGASTGCHLHFETRLDGAAEDAVPFMAKRGIRLG
jgi:murein DD-endopeptidase MepM/ murein hydrolase activator NlpD